MLRQIKHAMYRPQPADIELPATVSIDLSHLVVVAVAASMSMAQPPTSG
ncbi:hypothetical protein NQ152_02950 [Microbacterium sp. zg.B48]|nr:MULTISPECIES: hypothetical protein [unclassified Microbacterium]MCR2762462.1 hypothetical protein [Microbacterium sp. zg.B48]MCR2810606.1 hypothetical protein [Microbacterium sp. zg.B185]WIM18143.1 hypothetical protein QNO12_11065 [Microbacterium sp. zg-B185]